MADSHDTLNIGSLRPTPHPPAPDGHSTHDPATDQSAAAARERVAEQEHTLTAFAHDPEYPTATTLPLPGAHHRYDAKDPDSAAAARERIAMAESALPVYAHDPEYPMAPAHPTADLITDKHKLAEQFRKEPLVRAPKIPMPAWLRPILTAVGVFFLVLLLFKIPVIISQAQYAISSRATPAVLTPATEVVPADNTISIPKINVKVPVNYESSIQEAAIQKSLETGVVHYGNTALPGQAGNVAIFGHSSNDWWEPGNFKFVFVLLDKLSPGDQVTIDYQSTRYVYEVTGSKVVEPTDVSVLNPTSTPTLSIITCTPPGTSLKRLVVTARQISPDPNKAKMAVAPSGSASASSLPSGTTSGSFFDQFAQSWNSLMTMFGLGAPTATPKPSTTGTLPTAK